MSVMHRGQVQELALALVQLLEIQIPEDTDPIEPNIIIYSLAVLFPQEQDQLLEIINFESPEEQWNCVLEFIEINILDGQRIEVQSLGLEEIASIYQLLIEYTEQLFQESEVPQKQVQQKTKKPIHNEKRGQKEKDKPKKKSSSKKSPQVASSEKNNLEYLQAKNNQKSGEKIKEKKQIGSIKDKQKNKSKSKEKDAKSTNTNKRVEKQAKMPINNNKNSKKSQKPSPQKVTKALQVLGQPLQDQIIKEISIAMKGNIKKPKNKVLLKDPKSTEQVAKAKRQFEHYLSQYKREGKIKAKNDNKSKLKKSGLDQFFLKALQKRQKNIQETVINEQLKYFITLRDKKVAFVNKIHKLTEKLQKQRVIEKQKQQRRLMEEQRTKTYYKIQESNALFEKNMQLLKENYKNIKQKNELQEYNERQVCKQMEDCMKKKKLEQLQQLKMLWQQENMKLNNIMGDQEKVKNKLIDIYRRNRP